MWVPLLGQGAGITADRSLSRVVAMGQVQAAGDPQQIQAGLVFQLAHVVIGRPGQRGVLGCVVRVPDDPGVILGSAPVVAQPVLLQGQHAAATAPGQPVSRGGADTTRPQDDVIVGAAHQAVLP